MTLQIFSFLLSDPHRNIVIMVHCDFSLLLQLHHKMQRLLQCLRVDSAGNQAIPNEEGIVAAVIQQLDRTLQFLQVCEGGRDGQGGEGEYLGIEVELQRQEQLNRNFIRRELEFKEYQKCVLEELEEEKKVVKGLQAQLIKANERALKRDLEFLQLSKTVKEPSKKELQVVESLVTERKLVDPFKNLKDGAFTLHRRGNSDELALRTSTKIKRKAPAKK